MQAAGSCALCETWLYVYTACEVVAGTEGTLCTWSDNLDILNACKKLTFLDPCKAKNLLINQEAETRAWQAFTVTCVWTLGQSSDSHHCTAWEMGMYFYQSQCSAWHRSVKVGKGLDLFITPGQMQRNAMEPSILLSQTLQSSHLSFVGKWKCFHSETKTKRG